MFLCVLIVQFLVQREADLFAENENRETPCDCAEKQHHTELALCLESQMVFSLAPEAEGIEAEYAALDRREVQNTNGQWNTGNQLVSLETRKTRSLIVLKQGADKVSLHI